MRRQHTRSLPTPARTPGSLLTSIVSAHPRMHASSHRGCAPRVSVADRRRQMTRRYRPAETPAPEGRPLSVSNKCTSAGDVDGLALPTHVLGADADDDGRGVPSTSREPRAPPLSGFATCGTPRKRSLVYVLRAGGAPGARWLCVGQSGFHRLARRSRRPTAARPVRIQPRSAALMRGPSSTPQPPLAAGPAGRDPHLEPARISCYRDPKRRSRSPW